MFSLFIIVFLTVISVILKSCFTVLTGDHLRVFFMSTMSERNLKFSGCALFLFGKDTGNLIAFEENASQVTAAVSVCATETISPLTPLINSVVIPFSLLQSFLHICPLLPGVHVKFTAGSRHTETCPCWP